MLDGTGDADASYRPTAVGRAARRLLVASPMPHFSDYIVYVDESGDHSLESVDPVYPLFVLALCLFEKERYVQECAPAMIRLKFEHVGHDQIVLHEREVRKQLPPFDFLLDRSREEVFISDLTRLVEDAPFVLFAVVIDKRELQEGVTDNPYHIALRLGLEQIHEYLTAEAECEGGTLHIVFEQRGRTEDKELELEFLRVCGAPGTDGCRYPFGFVIADKRGNSTGLQLADLIARPVGLHVLRPDQPNRTWNILRPKFPSDSDGVIGQAGLYVYPSTGEAP